MKRVTFSIFIIVTVFFVNLYAKENEKEFDTFWKKFQLAVFEKNEKAVVEMTYLATKDEIEYFNFQMVFDDEAINIIKNTKSSAIKKIKRKAVSDENDPFEILDLPDKIKEMYILSVNYEDIEDEETIPYERVYAFGKYEGQYKFLGTYSIEQN
jgi:hypothetical protein